MKTRIERIVVPLDATADFAATIDTAARLAARWHVPLHAVFVEDEELLQAAGLPFTREVTLQTGREVLTPQQVETHFRAFAERARRDVAAAAARHHVEFSFAIARGPVATIALSDREHDFVVVSAATRPIGRHFRIARRGRRGPRGAAHSVLLARRAWQGGGSVVTIVRQRGPEAARRLDIAAQIAGFGGSRLYVLGAADLAQPEEFADWVGEVLEGRAVRVATEISGLEPAALRRRLVALDCRLVALGADHGELQQAAAECDVLITR
jgi:hypothetical protein